MADKSLPLDPEPQYMLIVTHQQAKRRSQKCHDSSKANLKDQNLGSGPITGNFRPFH